MDLFVKMVQKPVEMATQINLGKDEHKIVVVCLLEVPALTRVIKILEAMVLF
jgi:hypothetical protein